VADVSDIRLGDYKMRVLCFNSLSLATIFGIQEVENHTLQIYSDGINTLNKEKNDASKFSDEFILFILIKYYLNSVYECSMFFSLRHRVIFVEGCRLSSESIPSKMLLWCKRMGNSRNSQSQTR